MSGKKFISAFDFPIAQLFEARSARLEISHIERGLEFSRNTLTVDDDSFASGKIVGFDDVTLGGYIPVNIHFRSQISKSFQPNASDLGGFTIEKSEDGYYRAEIELLDENGNIGSGIEMALLTAHIEGRKPVNGSVALVEDNSIHRRHTLEEHLESQNYDLDDFLRLVDSSDENIPNIGVHSINLETNISA